jgi:hypothetical protein
MQPRLLYRGGNSRHPDASIRASSLGPTGRYSVTAFIGSGCRYYRGWPAWCVLGVQTFQVAVSIQPPPETPQRGSPLGVSTLAGIGIETSANSSNRSLFSRSGGGRWEKRAGVIRGLTSPARTAKSPPGSRSRRSSGRRGWPARRSRRRRSGPSSACCDARA